MQRDRNVVRTENLIQRHEINKLNERITTLQLDALLLPSKLAHESSFLGKRHEDDSKAVLDVPESRPQKSKKRTDMLSNKITALTKKKHTK
jgi:hypothetical protein